MEDNELFRIGEVSKLFHVSVGILRHYDKIGLLKPEFTDPETGYRYYSVRQFECLNTIRYLRALDIPLEKISVFLQNRNIDKIRELLNLQKEEVRKRQQELEVIEKKIENRLVQLEDAMTSEMDRICMVSRPSRRLASVRRKLDPRSYLDLEDSIRQIERAEQDTVTFLGKVGLGISPDNLKKRRFRPYDQVFILLDEEDHFRGDTVVIPEETCMAVRFCGSHERAEEYYALLMDEIEDRQYEIAGFSKEITMIDYGLTDDCSRFVTEIQIPVRVSAIPDGPGKTDGTGGLRKKRTGR